MQFLSIGECMIELSGAGDDLWRSGIAGDTFNTAWYAREALGPEWRVSYFTSLGVDPLSDHMCSFIDAAGIGTEWIVRHPTRVPGLYMITLEDGERSFTYWRDASAARCLADDPDRLARAVAAADLVYFSGITLAILSPERRQVLLDVLARRRVGGGVIAFDPNLRPRLWDSADTMRAAIMAAAAVSGIVLPSHDDEATHFGDASVDATAARYIGAGADEVIVKNGGGEMRVACKDRPIEVIAAGPRAIPVDTTGAGDSFNGAYLAARLDDAPPAVAAGRGHAQAMRVIGQRGALIPKG